MRLKRYYSGTYAESLNDEGSRLANEFRRIVDRIVSREAKLGFSSREMETVMKHVVETSTLLARLERHCVDLERAESKKVKKRAAK